MEDKKKQKKDGAFSEFQMPDPSNSKLYSLSDVQANDQWEHYVPEDSTVLLNHNQYELDQPSYQALDSKQKQLEGIQHCYLANLLEAISNKTIQTLIESISEIKLASEKDKADILHGIHPIRLKLKKHMPLLSFFDTWFQDLIDLLNNKEQKEEEVLQLFQVFLGLLKASVILAFLKHSFLKKIQACCALGSIHHLFLLIRSTSLSHKHLNYLTENLDADRALYSNFNFELFSLIQAKQMDSFTQKKEDHLDEIHMIHLQAACFFIHDGFNKQNMESFKEVCLREIKQIKKKTKHLKACIDAYQLTKETLKRRLDQWNDIHSTIEKLLKEETRTFSFLAKSVVVFGMFSQHHLNPKLNLEDVFDLIWDATQVLEDEMGKQHQLLSEDSVNMANYIQIMASKKYDYTFEIEEKQQKETRLHQLNLCVHQAERLLDEAKEIDFKLTVQKNKHHVLRLAPLTPEQCSYLQHVCQLLKDVNDSKGFDCFEHVHNRLLVLRRSLSTSEEQYVSESIPVYILEHFLLKNVIQRAIQTFKKHLMQHKKIQKDEDQPFRAAKQALHKLETLLKEEKQRSVIDRVQFPKSDVFKKAYDQLKHS